jgi:acyl-CoA synthetase (AMP-forming)/AMP-acid ligase II
MDGTPKSRAGRGARVDALLGYVPALAALIRARLQRELAVYRTLNSDPRRAARPRQAAVPAYKYPRRLRRVDELPKRLTGKILKRGIAVHS